jgi:hypothetical protein
MIRTYTKGYFNSILKNKGANPITLSETKTHLQIEEDYTSDDEYVTSLIDVATQLAEDYCGADLLPTENTMVVFEFYGQELVVEDGNYLSGLTITGTTTDFDVYENISSFRVVFNDFIGKNANYQDDLDQNLTLHYWTGFSSMPVVVKHAIKIKVADLYDMERNGYTTNTYKTNDVFGQLLSYYKKW